MGERYGALKSQKRIGLDEIRLGLIAEAQKMYDEDIAACRAMGDFGAGLMPEEGSVLDTLQCGCAGDVRLRDGSGGHSERVRRRRSWHVYADVDLSAGRAVDGMGIDA